MLALSRVSWPDGKTTSRSHSLSTSGVNACNGGRLHLLEHGPRPWLGILDQRAARPEPVIAAFGKLEAFEPFSYFQRHEPTDPLVSPLFGDLTRLPPLFVTATRGEVLLSDATRLAERAEKVGVDVTLRFGRGFRTCLHNLSVPPETKETMHEVARWARRNLQAVCATRSQAAE